MILFWSLALLLVAASLAFLLPPLLRRRQKVIGPDADAAAIAVYRDEKRALEAELVSGAISPAERDAALLELSHRLGEEIGTANPVSTARRPSRRAWIAAVVVLVLVPIAATVLYLRLGKPEATTVAAADATRAAHDMSDPQIAAMVEQLAQRMKAQPNDPQGWMLLGRSYAAMRRFQEAADAYARAAALVPDDAALLADYADTLAMVQGRSLAGKPLQLIEQALAIEPTNQKALALAATAALDRRDFSASLGYWRRLAAQFPEGSEEARQMASIIADVENTARQSGDKSIASTKPVTGGSPPGTAGAGPASGATIAGRVDVSPALASKVAGTDTVFIFARAVDGPRVPLAVLRLPAQELPRDFTLDDSMGMAPGAKLSAAQAVVVEARVSKTGNALPQAGDLSGKSAAVKPGARNVRIVIDQIVP
ncbi:MAG TPA: c-type cytochrome biogenesis protein CcmI [Casimicrobiaceae bacterium]|nr:c-type cytochrome biogenesis protein CcmI [Casimicrobiaceae bacterium]